MSRKEHLQCMWTNSDVLWNNKLTSYILGDDK